MPIEPRPFFRPTDDSDLPDVSSTARRSSPPGEPGRGSRSAHPGWATLREHLGASRRASRDGAPATDATEPSTAVPSAVAMPSTVAGSSTDAAPSAPAVPSTGAAPSATAVPSTGAAPSATAVPSTGAAPSISASPSAVAVPSIAPPPAADAGSSIGAAPSAATLPSISASPAAVAVPSVGLARSTDAATPVALPDWESALGPDDREALEAYEQAEFERLCALSETDEQAFYAEIGHSPSDDPGPSDEEIAEFFAEAARLDAELRDLTPVVDPAIFGDAPDDECRHCASAAGGFPVAAAHGSDEITSGLDPDGRPTRADAAPEDSLLDDAIAERIDLAITQALGGELAAALPWLAERVARLAAAWSTAVTRGAATAERLDESIRLLDDSALLTVLDEASGLQRQLNGAIARLGSEVADRSDHVAGRQGLAKRAGHRNPAQLVATALGAPTAEGRRLIRTGRALFGRPSITGEPLPPMCRFVDAALSDGEISTFAADAIIGLRDRICDRVDVDVIDEAEEMLASIAPEMPLGDLTNAIAYAEAHLDPDGTEPATEQMREHRALSWGRNAAGMVTLSGKFDPETAAPIKAAIESIVTHQLRGSRGSNLVERDEYRRLADGPRRELTPDELTLDAPAADVSDDSGARGGAAASSSTEFSAADAPGGGGTTDNEHPGAVTMEGRSLAQLRADALVSLCKHANGCASDELPAPTTAVVVRIPVSELVPAVVEPAPGASDAGAAAPATAAAPFDPVCEIDGIGPIDAGTARRMAAAANIIPIVLGVDSEVLDLGRSTRLFTRAQRLALVERDGGCAFCGLPPAFAEAHHLVHWQHGGTTDLDNGILVCTTCHGRLHDYGWEVVVVPPDPGRPRPPRGGGTVWFIPPSSIDLERRPRLGGRKRFDPAYRRAYPPTPPPR